MNNIRDVLGSKMSTGMKQKVSIARTIVHDPPVLIFDEPTSGLDVLVARMLSRVKSRREQGKCIIYSTHICGKWKSCVTAWQLFYRGASWPLDRSKNWVIGISNQIGRIVLPVDRRARGKLEAGRLSLGCRVNCRPT